MRTDFEEYFGTADQRKVQQKAALLWELLKRDPDFACHGRAVSVSGATHETTGRQIALARLQGVGPSDGVPKADKDDRCTALQDAGLEIDEFVSWRSGADTVQRARNTLATRCLPDDLVLVAVSPQTPANEMQALNALTSSCDVLLPMGRFMRGLERPSVCLMAGDPTGKIVAASAAVAQFHPDHPRHRSVWWGMLATDPERRGQGLAQIMGATALVAMADNHGSSDFFTGIRKGNAPSEKLCAKLGLEPGDETDIIAICPRSLGGGKLTK